MKMDDIVLQNPLVQKNEGLWGKSSTRNISLKCSTVRTT